MLPNRPRDDVFFTPMSPFVLSKFRAGETKKEQLEFGRVGGGAGEGGRDIKNMRMREKLL